MRPRLPVRCRASRPFGTISPATARPFGLWITRSASWFPMKRRREPTAVLVLRRVATTWLPPWPGRNQLAVGFAARRALSTSPYGMRRSRQTVARCAYSPLRLEPPMAMDDRGLALPRELSACFPEPSDFSADAFHNRSAHTQSIHERRPGASGCGRLIPIIHRGGSLLGVGTEATWRFPWRQRWLN